MNKDHALDNFANDSQFMELDELERSLESQLGNELEELEILKEDREKIGNPDSLGQVVKDVVWEQFMNQIGVVAGQDFIKKNGDMKLDLRDSAHIQTTENFANGKIASHNKKIDYQTRYDDWQRKFQHNDDGSVKTKPARFTGNPEAVLTKDAREYIDKDRPKGSASMHMDHVVSAAEIIRDPAAAAHMTQQEHCDYANSKVNLNEMDGAANESKRDARMTDWLESKRNGQTPAERFNIDEKDLRKKDETSRKEFEKRKTEAEKKSVEAGKQSQKEEAFRIGGEALRAVVMSLLAELVKNVIQKLIAWLKSSSKSVSSLVDSLKASITQFVSNLKTHLKNAANGFVTTIATAIIGPVVGLVKKVWMILKQGYKSIKQAIQYIKDPKNRNKSFGIMMMEVGKIVIAGVTGVGALLLGETIEKALLTIPFFAVQIPLLGSLGSLLGIFFGALISGIIGAIALNLIDKALAKKQNALNDQQQFDKKNDILTTQAKLLNVTEMQVVQTKKSVAANIKERHLAAAGMIKELDQKINDDIEISKQSRERTSELQKSTEQELDDIFKKLDNL